MTDTAQSLGTAETVVSSGDPIADAANAFKAHIALVEQPERPRGPDGKFVSAESPQEIEAEDEAEQPVEAEAESQEETETDEAAEEAQPEAVDLPPSWPSELAEEWNSLPAPLQDKIVQREAEREAAVNAKFQEAANVRKANEAVITEANAARQKFAEEADLVLSLVQPQRPPMSMLNPQSHDYNPDQYHLLNAEYERTNEIISEVKQRRQDAAAQLAQEAQTAEQQAIAAIEERSRPLLLKDVPDLADANKQPAVLQGLVQYAIQSGIPEYVFTDPEMAKGVTSAQLHLTWKAQQYDRMMAAKGKVQPKAAKPAAPVVRPGVATSRSAVEASQRKQQVDRLDREGSIEAGAAIFKNMFKTR
jgi:hypothetical protein